MRRDLGDFQTPPGLVAAVLETLGPIGSRWPRVLEPTCGRGHFIGGLLAHSDPPREIQAIEIQQSHHRAARALLGASRQRGVQVSIKRRDLFDLDLKRDLPWREQGPLLVIGNPPWVTNSELGTLASQNRPPRRNIKGLRGLEARTGASNFDVAEAVWLKLVFELADQEPTIALLCKTAVARSVLQFTHRAGHRIATASIHKIDAARWFSAAVDACLFCVTLSPPCEGGARGGGGSYPGNQEPLASKLSPPCEAGLFLSPPCEGGARGGGGSYPGNQEALSNRNGERASDRGSSLRIPVYPDLVQRSADTAMGFAGGWLVADYDAHSRWAFADGVCPLNWWQGLKHDAATVMELVREGASGGWRNRRGELVDVEPEFVYPLVKGTDLARRSVFAAARGVLVTQERLGDDTARLAGQAPRLWSYLQSHAATFSKRKSSIYRGQPPFALFGIGPYSFAPYKVAVSGLGKTPTFRALGPVQRRQVMLDDTCYFLPCPTAAEASILTALCNDPITLGLIGSMSFRDAKRPITKKLLQRLDFAAILERADRRPLLSRATSVLNDDLATQPTEPLPDVVERLGQEFREENHDINH